MLDAMDPAIKLFGRSISLPEKDTFGETAKAHVEVPIRITSDKLGTIEKNSSFCRNKNGEDMNQSSDSTVMLTQEPEQDQFEAAVAGQEKAVRRPDKVLQCPRCNSMDTKFCYYNNYNINQPRYFCKNCQRYWTAGGTMRNVPVGAGRRKNKHSISHFRHTTTSSDGMQCGRVEAADSSHSKALLGGLSSSIVPPNATGTVLKPSQEGPLCDTMASVLNLSEEKRSAEMGSVTCGGESKEEPSCSSSVTVPSCTGNEFPGTAGCMEQTGSKTSCDGVTPLHHMQCYSSVPWAYSWSLGLNNLTAMANNQCSSMLSHTPENGNSGPVTWSPPSVIAPPLFCTPSIPVPIIPTSFLGCMPGWPNSTLNVPWPGSNGGISPSSSASNSRCLTNGSPTLGKHCRDANGASEEKTEKSLWVPKTLRIDDPDAAAKSSIWATLGIRPHKDIKKGGIFKAFHSMNESKVQTPEAAHVLHANPAALSRSQTFQEST